MLVPLHQIMQSEKQSEIFPVFSSERMRVLKSGIEHAYSPGTHPRGLVTKVEFIFYVIICSAIIVLPETLNKKKIGKFNSYLF